MASNPYAKYLQPETADPVIARDPYKVEDQAIKRGNAARAEEDQEMQREKFNFDREQASKPKLPTGMQWGPDGKTAVPIPGVPVDKDAAGGNARAAKLRSMLDQLERVEKLFEEEIEGGLPNPIWGRIAPISEGNSKFGAAAASMAQQAFSAFRTPGEGPQSDADLKLFAEANRPLPHDTDAAIKEKLSAVRKRAMAELGAIEGGPTAAPSDPRKHGETILRSKLDELKANFLAKNPKGQKQWEAIEAKAWRQFNNDKRVTGPTQRSTSSGGWGKVKVVD